MARDLYSASEEDLEKIGYFFADQVIGELPKNTTMPVIDILSSGSPAQSASQYAKRARGLGLK